MVLIIIGVVFVVVGCSKQLGFAGFNNADLLAAVGAVMIAWGVTQIRRRRRESQQQLGGPDR